jgi:hypothetical protein
MYLPEDGTVTQTVQKKAFTSRWKCCSDSSKSNIFQWMKLLFRQFREQHLPVDGNVAQIVQRAAFTSR